MKLLPYENFYIYSSLKPAEVQARLAEVVSPWSGYTFNLRGSSPAGPWTTFKGDVSTTSFAFEPTIINRNSFLPQISGSIEDYNTGSKIHVKMTLYLTVMILTIFILAVAGAFCIYLFPELISAHHRGYDIAPYLIFLIYYSVATGAFKMESITSREYLIELLS